MHYELATRLLTGCIKTRRFVLLHDPRVSEPDYHPAAD
jgi:hypothetical protein